jgi:hypothetical protein
VNIGKFLSHLVESRFHHREVNRSAASVRKRSGSLAFS